MKKIHIHLSYLIMPITAVIIGILIFNGFFNAPIFSDSYNSTTTISIISSCSYDFWSGRTNIYLNNGLLLHFNDNINLQIGAKYEIVYRIDSNRIISWKFVGEK